MHRRFHVSSRVFKCTVCDYVCIHAKSLRNHMKKKHVTNNVKEQEDSLQVVVVDIQEPINDIFI